jgi:putative peptide zinc metalloprotease protein
METDFSLKFLLCLLVLYGCSILHEFGHAAAGKRFGATPGDIGFGFYFIAPVFFSDLSDVWKLPPKERIIVNLGGIYFELIVASQKYVQARTSTDDP